MTNMNHIDLIGDPEENFYSLGAKDKDAYQEVHNLISRLCARSDFLAKAIKLSSEMAVNINKRGALNLNKELQAYADGLERPIKDVYFNLLLPEIVASFNKWTPNLMSIIPGCSSLFTYNTESKSVIHTRVLDYALSGPFEKYERSLKIDFKKRLKIFGLNTAGMPFPSLSSMNESGLTVALHYKHGDFLNLKGDSIFSIVYQILSYCTSVHDVKKFLKNYPSMAHWGLYISDKQGLVASIDVKGNEVYQEKFDIKDHKYLYFNNRPLLIDENTEKLQPFGNFNQCNMRRNSLDERVKNKNLKELNTQEILKLTTTPNINNKEWKMDIITPSSIQAMSFNSKSQTCSIIPKGAPKYYQGEIGHYENIFNEIKYEIKSNKIKKNSQFLKGQAYIANFQSELDRGNIENAYHAIQMSYEYLKNTNYASIIKFYIYILQYIYESNNKDLAYLYNDFKNLEGKLPEYLNDHRVIFMMRLEKLLGHPIIAEIDLIKNQNLKLIYESERKLKPTAIKLLKKLIFPRIEVLDIIYGY